MEITGTSGAKSDKFMVDLVLIDPCFTVDLGIQTTPHPFSDTIYVLRDNPIEMQWKAIDLISPATSVDCGPISVEFFNDISMSALDPELFVDDQTLAPANIFRVLYSEDVAKKGSYPFRYRVYHTNYSLNVIEQPFPFTVTVINSCENPVSLQAPTLENQEYTITGGLVTYTVPIFTVDPDWCDIIYSFEVTDPTGQNAITFDANMDQRIFTFFNDNDIALANNDFKDYIVKVKAHAGIVTFKDTFQEFTLSLKNPCVDPAYVLFNK